MWMLQLNQAYYDSNQVWCGSGYPIDLQSKFGDTQAILQEIKDFLKEQNDEEPLTTTAETIDTIWEKAQQDPSQDYYITLRTNTYNTPPEGEDESDGTIELHLYITYNIEKTPAEESPPEPKLEQLNLF